MSKTIKSAIFERIKAQVNTIFSRLHIPATILFAGEGVDSKQLVIAYTSEIPDFAWMRIQESMRSILNELSKLLKSKVEFQGHLSNVLWLKLHNELYFEIKPLHNPVKN